MSDANHSAFPESYVGNDMPHEGIGGGLTKREYFAAKAMQGMQANAAMYPSVTTEFIARFSVQAADALIAELDKEVEQDD